MDLLQGTLDMLVLRTLIIAPLHGYRVAQPLGNHRSTTSREASAAQRLRADEPIGD